MGLTESHTKASRMADRSGTQQFPDAPDSTPKEFPEANPTLLRNSRARSSLVTLSSKMLRSAGFLKKPYRQQYNSRFLTVPIIYSAQFERNPPPLPPVSPRQAEALDPGAAPVRLASAGCQCNTFIGFGDLSEYKIPKSLATLSNPLNTRVKLGALA